MICSILALLWVVVARISGPADSWDHAQPRTLSYTTDILVNGGVHWILPIERGDYPATKPPLYNWLAAPVVALCGYESEVAHKWPSIAAMAACWLVLVRLGRALGDDSLGWLAGMVFCANALVFKLGYLARPDMLLTLCVLCGWAAATVVLAVGPVQTSTRPGTHPWGICNVHTSKSGFDPSVFWTFGRLDVRTFVFWLCVALAALAKGPAAIILPVFALAAAKVVGGSWRGVHRLRWRTGLPLSLAIFGTWLWAVWQINPDHVRDTLWQAEIYGRVTGLGPEGSREGWIGWFSTLPSLAGYVLIRFAPWWIGTVGAIVMLWQGRSQKAEIRGQSSEFSSSSLTSDRCALTSAPTSDLSPLTSDVGAWMRSAAVMAVAVVGLFSLSASTRGDYLAPAVPQASLLAAWWMREFRRGSRVERPWLPASFAAVTLIVLTVLNRLEHGAPTRGFGDEIDQFIHRAGAHIAAAPHPVGFWRVGSEHGGLHLQAFLGLSQSEDPWVLKAQIAELRGPMWIIAGLRDTPPRTFPAWLPMRSGSFLATEVEQSKRMPQGRSAFPQSLTLYLLEPGPEQ